MMGRPLEFRFNAIRNIHPSVVSLQGETKAFDVTYFTYFLLGCLQTYLLTSMFCSPYSQCFHPWISGHYLQCKCKELLENSEGIPREH